MTDQVIRFIAKMPKRDAYLFQITNKKGKVIRKYFSASAYGHINVALRAAIKYRDNFILKEFVCSAEERGSYKQRTPGISRENRGKRKDGSQIINFVGTCVEDGKKKLKILW